MCCWRAPKAIAGITPGKKKGDFFFKMFIGLGQVRIFSADFFALYRKWWIPRAQVISFSHLGQCSPRTVAIPNFPWKFQTKGSDTIHLLILAACWKVLIQNVVFKILETSFKTYFTYFYFFFARIGKSSVFNHYLEAIFPFLFAYLL